METRGPVKLEVLRAKRARKALDEIAIELADNGELSHYVESIDRIAKGKGFETWKHLLEFSGREYSGLKETLAVDIRGKQAPLPAK